jgi:hypothetical protein
MIPYKNIECDQTSMEIEKVSDFTGSTLFDQLTPVQQNKFKDDCPFERLEILQVGEEAIQYKCRADNAKLLSVI